MSAFLSDVLISKFKPFNKKTTSWLLVTLVPQSWGLQIDEDNTCRSIDFLQDQCWVSKC